MAGAVTIAQIASEGREPLFPPAFSFSICLISHTLYCTEYLTLYACSCAVPEWMVWAFKGLCQCDINLYASSTLLITFYCNITLEYLHMYLPYLNKGAYRDPCPYPCTLPCTVPCRASYIMISYHGSYCTFRVQCDGGALFAIFSLPYGGRFGDNTNNNLLITFRRPTQSERAPVHLDLYTYIPITYILHPQPQPQPLRTHRSEGWERNLELDAATPTISNGCCSAFRNPVCASVGKRRRQGRRHNQSIRFCWVVEPGGLLAFINPIHKETTPMDGHSGIGGLGRICYYSLKNLKK